MRGRTDVPRAEPGSLESQAQSKSLKDEPMETPQPDDWPTRAWRIASPQALHMDPEALSQLHAYASRIEHLHSILVVRSGRIVFEHYYRGWGPNHYHNLFSATKSIISALIGIALREGSLQTLDQCLLDFFPEAESRARDPHAPAITLRHLLTMSSGYDYPKEPSKLLDDSETITKMLARPMKSQPGQVFSYDDLGVHLLGRILTKVTDTSLANFALHKLFQPLGIWQDEQGTLFPWKSGTSRADFWHPFYLPDTQHGYLWTVDRLGYYWGGSGLQFTPREMAKFGYLYLKQGWWDGKEIVPAWYVQESLRQQMTDEHGQGYGYLWWRSEVSGHEIPHAAGHGGQIIALAPDLDLVFVITSAVGDDYPHIEAVMDFIIAAVA